MKITMMMAVTADGKIAKSGDHFPDWTSPEDKKFFMEISKENKVLLMGDKTYDTLPGPLPGRFHVVFTYDKNRPKTENIRWVSGDPKKVLDNLEAEGHKTALLGGGAFLNSLFLENKLINEIIITVEPIIFGSGLSLFDKDFNISLELKELKKINNNSFVVRYGVIY